MVCAAFIHQKRGLCAPLVVVAGGGESGEVVFNLMILLCKIIKEQNKEMF